MTEVKFIVIFKLIFLFSHITPTLHYVHIKSTNTSFTLFPELPSELRAPVWQSFYETTPCHVFDVEITDRWGSWCHIAVNGSAVYGSGEKRIRVRDTLIKISSETQEFLRRRFISFASDLPAAGPGGNSLPLLQEVEFDPARDRLSISAKQPIPISSNLSFITALKNLPGNQEMEKQATQFPLSKLFRLLFVEKAEEVAWKLTELEVDCVVNRYFRIFPWGDVKADSGESQQINDIKAYLPKLRKLQINCDCHCRRVKWDCVNTVGMNLDVPNKHEIVFMKE